MLKGQERSVDLAACREQLEGLGFGVSGFRARVTAWIIGGLNPQTLQVVWAGAHCGLMATPRTYPGR